MNKPSRQNQSGVNSDMWVRGILQKIQSQTEFYTDREKQNTRISFLINAVKQVPFKIEEAEIWDEFQQKVEQVVELLPEKQPEERLEYGTYLKTITNFKSYIQQKFKYVSKGFNLRIWFVLGLAIGLCLGVAFGHIVLGVPLGIGIGLVVGSFLDKKAVRENRVL